MIHEKRVILFIISVFSRDIISLFSVLIKQSYDSRENHDSDIRMRFADAKLCKEIVSGKHVALQKNENKPNQ